MHKGPDHFRQPDPGCPACGATRTAELRAAADPAAVGADTAEELRAAGTKALRSAPEHRTTAPVNTRERTISLAVLEASSWMLGCKSDEYPGIALYQAP